jgi:GNAT superfamily N-acetyltransferase
MNCFKEYQLNEIQPTQLYLSERKLKACQAYFSRHGFDEYDPVPVKRIGHDLFYTDGHTRAYTLWQQGFRSIRTVADTDNLNWIAYMANMQWCRTSGIECIADLSGRVLTHSEYQTKWYDRCDKLQNMLKTDPLTGLELDFELDAGVKQRVCREVLQALPEWFGIEEAVDNYVADVVGLPFINAVLYEKSIGFCALKINFNINADLYVLGLFREFHGLGIGSRMIRFIESYCAQTGIRYMTVKTLSARHSDAHYEATRLFYECARFVGIEEFPTLWGEHNPCLYMIKDVM